MTTFIPRRITACASKAGKTYWKIETDQGEATCFDYPIVQTLEGNIGKPISLYDLESNNGFTNIRPTRHAKAEAKVQEQAFNNAMQPPQFSQPKAEDNFKEARNAKDVSIYTSYAKDIFMQMQAQEYATRTDKGMGGASTENLMKQAVDLIKQAKVSFERSDIFKAA